LPSTVGPQLFALNLTRNRCRDVPSGPRFLEGR
jgi:hypothetical protein